MPAYKFIKKADSATLRQIISLYENQGWWTKGDGPAAAAAIVRNSHCFLLALDRDRAVGMARAISDRTSDAYIQDVTVLRTHRSLGLGSELVLRVKARLARDGIKWIGLIAQNGSRDFYKKLGFKVIKRADPMMLKGNHV